MSIFGGDTEQPKATTLTREMLDEAIRQVTEAPYQRSNYPTFPEGFLAAISPFFPPKQTIFTDRERNRLAMIVAQLPEPLHPEDYRFLRDAMERWEIYRKQGSADL